MKSQDLFGITGWEIALLVFGAVLTLLLLCFIIFLLVAFLPCLNNLFRIGWAAVPHILFTG